MLSVSEVWKNKSTSVLFKFFEYKGAWVELSWVLCPPLYSTQRKPRNRCTQLKYLSTHSNQVGSWKPRWSQQSLWPKSLLYISLTCMSINTDVLCRSCISKWMPTLMHGKDVRLHGTTGLPYSVLFISPIFLVSFHYVLWSQGTVVWSHLCCVCVRVRGWFRACVWVCVRDCVVCSHVRTSMHAYNTCISSCETWSAPANSCA